MKRLAVFLLAVFFLLSAAGCDGGNQSSDASDSGTSSVSTEVADSSEEGTEVEPITIQFWNGWTGADGEILTKYYDTFTLANEVVEVMIESVVVNNEDITTALNTAQDNAEAALEKFLSQ